MRKVWCDWLSYLLKTNKILWLWTSCCAAVHLKVCSGHSSTWSRPTRQAAQGRQDNMALFEWDDLTGLWKFKPPEEGDVSANWMEIICMSKYIGKIMLAGCCETFFLCSWGLAEVVIEWRLWPIMEGHCIERLILILIFWLSFTGAN